MPMTRSFLNFPLGPAIAPEWTAAANSLMAASVEVISLAISGVGASCGARSQ